MGNTNYISNLRMLTWKNKCRI